MAWTLLQDLTVLAHQLSARIVECSALGVADRLEIERLNPYVEARNIALHTPMISTINPLIAVGLVTLPGMMAGQILSDVPPLVAVKYQVIIMCIVFGDSGISATLHLVLTKPK